MFGRIWNCLGASRSPWPRIAAVATGVTAATALPYYIVKRNRTAASRKSRFYSDAVKDLVFMDFAIGNRYIGRVLIGLYTEHVPLSAENFIQLCKGYRVKDKVIGYRNTQVHRVQQGVAMFAGDVLTGNGADGLSIYGPKFPDENFSMEFIQDGDVALFSRGPNSNNSQFMITFRPLPVLNRQHVVIGTVLKGMKVIRKIEDLGTKGGIPTEHVRIVNCGIYKGPSDGPPFFSFPELLEDGVHAPMEESSFTKLSLKQQLQLLGKDVTKSCET